MFFAFQELQYNICRVEVMPFSVSFGNCIQFCSHYHGEGAEVFHHLPPFLLPLCS